MVALFEQMLEDQINMYFHHCVLLGFVDLYQEHLRNVTYLELVNHSNDQRLKHNEAFPFPYNVTYTMFMFYHMLKITRYTHDDGDADHHEYFFEGHYICCTNQKQYPQVKPVEKSL